MSMSIIISENGSRHFWGAGIMMAPNRGKCWNIEKTVVLPMFCITYKKILRTKPYCLWKINFSGTNILSA